MASSRIAVAVGAVGAAAALVLVPTVGQAVTGTTSKAPSAAAKPAGPKPTTGPTDCPYPPRGPNMTMGASKNRQPPYTKITQNGKMVHNDCRVANNKVGLYAGDPNSTFNTMTLVATTTTGKNGTFHFTVKPATSTRYVAYFAGDATQLSALSNYVLVTVRR